MKWLQGVHDADKSRPLTTTYVLELHSNISVIFSPNRIETRVHEFGRLLTR